MPSKIVVDGEMGYIQVFLKESKIIIEKPIFKIKKVIDEKEWYYLKFSYLKLDGLICQKSLITEGTIKEFEKLFESKIIRKPNKE